MCSPDDLDILELVDEELVPAVDVGVLHDPSRHVIVSRDTGSCCVWKLIKKTAGGFLKIINPEYLSVYSGVTRII